MDFALFENNIDQNGNSLLFTEPVDEIFITNIEELEKALAKISQFQKLNYYTIGYISYDITSRLINSAPLLHFIAYKQLTTANHTELISLLSQHDINLELQDQYKISYIESEIDHSKYSSMFSQVIDNLTQGNSYQINLTKRLNADLSTNDLFSLYYQISRANPVAYSAYLPFHSQTIISISPELFFQKNKDKIIVKPMKGTASRSNEVNENESTKTHLQQDDKNIAENLIIVDLLRNDLAKFAKPGSIKVEKLFEIEEYKTLFQMTSLISAQIDISTSLSTIINGLFPCGSITGAPKKKTIELIQEIEQSARGVYTGCIGYILPNNDMLFNVAIRTITKSPKDVFAKIGVGGGITINSNANDEWNEMNTKLRFISDKFYHPDFNIIESLLIKGKKVYNLQQHLDRLKSSADKLLFKCNNKLIKQQINELINELPNIEDAQSYKLRIELYYNGTFDITYELIAAIDTPYKLMLLDYPINTTHPLFKHKTTSEKVRGLYTKLDKKYKPQEVNEIIFINHNGQISESRFYNIIIQINNQLITPPIECGLLGGIFRNQMIEKGNLKEQIITPEMLLIAEKIYLCNDVRGLIDATYHGVIKP